MSILETIEAARRRGDFQLLVEAIPYARFLGVSTRLDGRRLVTSLPFSPRNVGNPELPAIHGGAIGAFLELAAVFELLWGLESATIPKTVNITVDYLRSAGPHDCHATGVITKLGRRVANVRVEAWQTRPDRPIAHGHAHFLVTPAGPGGDDA